MVWVWWSVSGIWRVPKWQIAEGVIMADFHKRGVGGISAKWDFVAVRFNSTTADAVFWQNWHISESCKMGILAEMGFQFFQFF